MNAPNNPRIGFRPNMYARPPSVPAPRAILPTSRNIMLKPGFETSSTSYSRPAASSSKTPVSQESPTIGPYPTLSTFMFTEEELKNTPSFRHHNVPYDEEMTLRRSGTFFIKELCQRLNTNCDKRSKISSRAMSVAMIYLNRFYMFHSVTTFNPLHLSAACLFLAAKCEECPRKLASFSRQLYSMLHPEDHAPLEPDEMEPMNSLITALETSVLSTLGFELEIDLPHVHIIGAPFSSSKDHLRKMAYYLSGDLLATTTLVVQHDSKTLAAACFFVAASYLDIDMEKEYGEKWYNELNKTLTESVLLKIVKCFTDSLTECKDIIRAEELPRQHDNHHTRGDSASRSYSTPDSSSSIPKEGHHKPSTRGEIPKHVSDSRQHSTTHAPSAVPSRHHSSSSIDYRSREHSKEMPSSSNPSRSLVPNHPSLDHRSREHSKEMPSNIPPRTSFPDHSSNQRSRESSHHHTSREMPSSNPSRSLVPEKPRAPYEQQQHRSFNAQHHSTVVASSHHTSREHSKEMPSNIPSRTAFPDHSSSSSNHRSRESSYSSHHSSRDHSKEMPSRTAFPEKPRAPYEQQQHRSFNPQHHSTVAPPSSRPHHDSYHRLEAPLLVPPPLPPPSSEMRKRKTPSDNSTPDFDNRKRRPPTTDLEDGEIE